MQPARKSDHSDSPEVTALRKRIRGEALTDAEAVTLARTYREPPTGGTIPHETIMRELAERERRGE